MKSTAPRSVHPSEAKPPAGHYSPGVICNGLLFVSGQLPIDAISGAHESGPIKAQTELVLRNLDRILQAAGSRREWVVQTTVYMADVKFWDQFNAVYATFFGEHRPARVVVPTPPLHHGFLIELAAVAWVDSDDFHKESTLTATNQSPATAGNLAPGDVIEAVVDESADSAGDVGG